ncbi:MAG TPA: glycosyltransferase family 39 protein [Thermogutta sp.]|nr:glycosyltransferase family 39 protein [Thermogutta sp.]
MSRPHEPKTNHQGRMCLVVVFLAALAVRVVAAVAWEWHFGPRFVFGDSESYWHLARCLAHCQPYRFGDFGTVFRTPGYPALLAPLFWFFDSPPTLAARIEGSLLGAIGALVTAIWAGNLFGSRARWLAGLIMAFHPEMVLSSILILSEGGFLPVWLVHLLVLSQALSRTHAAKTAWKEWFLAGCLVGLATLIRPAAILWLPFCATVTITFFTRQRLQLVILWAVCLLAFGLTMSLWWVRNYRVTGRWILTTTQAGPTLYDGLHPGATGASDMSFVPNKFRELQQSRPDARPIDLELEFDRRLSAEAIRWAWSHPRQVVSLAIVKFRRLWNPFPNDPGFNVWPINLIVAGCLLGVLVLGLAGCLKFKSIGWPVAVCWLPAVYVTLLHVIFVASIRYRWPAIPGLIVLGAGFLAETIQGIRVRDVKMVDT